MAAEVGKVVHILMNSDAKASISRRAGRCETTAKVSGSRCTIFGRCRYFAKLVLHYTSLVFYFGPLKPPSPRETTDQSRINGR